MEFGRMSAETADIDDIVKSISNSYGDLAASEVLTRALVAERNKDRSKAEFWMNIYQTLIAFEARTPGM
jgi:hypothetical protein